MAQHANYVPYEFTLDLAGVTSWEAAVAASAALGRAYKDGDFVAISRAQDAHDAALAALLVGCEADEETYIHTVSVLGGITAEAEDE